eukprot:9492381-Pyramimonas_sp.AAC.1
MVMQPCSPNLSYPWSQPSTSWKRKVRRIKLAAFRQVEIDIALMGMGCCRYVPTECAAPGHRSHNYLPPALEGGWRLRCRGVVVPESPATVFPVPESAVPASVGVGAGSGSRVPESPATEPPVPVGAVPVSVAEAPVFHGPESPESGLS